MLAALKTHLVALVLCLCCAYFLTYFSMHNGNRAEHKRDSALRELSILNGETYVNGEYSFYFPELQNRLLFPALLATTATLVAADPVELFDTLFLLTSALSLYAVWFAAYLLSNRNTATALVAIAVATPAVALSFTHHWIHSSDILDAGFIALVALCCARQNFVALLTVVAVALFNRESAVFAGIVWMACYMATHDHNTSIMRKIAAVGAGILLSAATYATVLAVRYHFGAEHGLERFQINTVGYNLNGILGFFTDKDFYGWYWFHLAIAAGMGVWIRADTAFTRLGFWLLMSAIAVYACTIIFSHLHEIRAFVPVITLLVMSGAANRVRITYSS